MAAKVAAPSKIATQHAIFSSVFPGPLQPPRNRQQFEVDVSQLTLGVKRQLTESTGRALGIGDEQYVYSLQHGRAEFKSHFVTCPSMDDVPDPVPQDRTNIMGNMAKTQSNSQLTFWRQRLGPDRLKKIFAGVIDTAVSDFVQWAYAGFYSEEVQRHARWWTANVLALYIKVCLYLIDHSAPRLSEVPQPTELEVEKYQSMTITRLWSLRVDELFDMVVDRESTAAGMDDLKPLLNTPLSRLYVAEKFTRVLHTRLLHPGASTIEILQVYISIIRAFRRLDPRGVLLSKVSGRVRQYLRERDDTVQVVVAGLLSDPESSIPSSSNPIKQAYSQMSAGTLSELAWELQNRDPATTKHTSNLDWNNMSWQPDPIDAAPTDQPHGRAAKHTDVIGSIISLFDSKDTFIKELQNTLAERLLRNKPDYDQETSVIEHLKIRFGDTALQSCEVMLRDVLDSRRLDSVIRADQGLDQTQFVEKNRAMSRHTQEADPEIHAKILSRLFWPSLPGTNLSYDDEERQFKPPISIAHQRAQYETGFEKLKQTRKLTWNDNLGQVEIELSFADGRTYIDEVLPYQAGVVYAFNDDGKDPHDNQPVSKTVQELSEELSLNPTLVRSACLLFVSKRVLTTTPSKPDIFTVLEHLPASIPTSNPTTANPDTQSSSAAAQVTAASAPQPQIDRAAELASQTALREAEAKERRAKLAVYQQFITAMLTNQGAMPLPRIAMMLGIVVPGGFAFSNEELREFLGGMVREGVVDVSGGGMYSIKK